MAIYASRDTPGYDPTKAPLLNQGYEFRKGCDGKWRNYEEDGGASLLVGGVVHGRAFALAKEGVGAAVRALKADLLGSLRLRLHALLDEVLLHVGCMYTAWCSSTCLHTHTSALLDEVEEAAEEEGGGLNLSLGAKWELPLARRVHRFDPSTASTRPSTRPPVHRFRRVHVDVGGGLSLCDTIGEGVEEEAAAAANFATLLNVSEEHLQKASGGFGPEVIARAPPPRMSSATREHC